MLEQMQLEQMHTNYLSTVIYCFIAMQKIIKTIYKKIEIKYNISHYCSQKIS